LWGRVASLIGEMIHIKNEVAKKVVDFVYKFPPPFRRTAPQVFVSIRLKDIAEAGSVYSSIDAKTHAH